MAPTFAGAPGDSVGLQISGTTHLFVADGSLFSFMTGTILLRPAQVVKLAG